MKVNHQIEYHGWVSFLPETSNQVERELEPIIRDIQQQYPMFLNRVNGFLHVHFSGAPNHYGQEGSRILEACRKWPGAIGMVYLVDHDSGDHPSVIKLQNGKVFEGFDRNLDRDLYAGWVKGADN